MIKHIYVEANVEQEKDTSENKKFLLERIYLEDENGKITTIDRASENKSYEEFEASISEILTENFGDKAKKGNILEPSEDDQWYVLCRDKEYPVGTELLNNLDETMKKQKEEEAIQYANLQVNPEVEEVFNGKKALLTAGAVAGAVIIGLAGYQAAKNKNADNKTDDNSTSIEASVEDEVIKASVTESISLDGQDWNYYLENAAETDQKDFYKSLGNYLLNYNCNEAWETITLTDEQIDEINEIGNFKLEKGKDNVQRIALTPEEFRDFAVAYGDFSREERAAIYYGEQVDLQEALLGKDSNIDRAKNYLLAYVLNSEEQDFHFEEFEGLFDENEIEDIKYWSSQQREYINLVKSGKTKEAETKMRDIRKEFEQYSRRTDNDTDAKAFIIEIFNGAFLVESNIAGYTHDVLFYANDNYTGETVELVAKNQPLWDNLFEAFEKDGLGEPCYEDGYKVGGFDAEALIKAAGKSTDRYTFAENSQGNRNSYIDKASKNIVEKFEASNEYVLDASNKAKAKEGGYENKQIEDLLQKELVKQNKDAHYNEGIIFSQYSAFKQRFAEILANVKGSAKAGITNAKGVLASGYKRVISKKVVSQTKSTQEWTEDVSKEEIDKQFKSIEDDAKEGKTKVVVKDKKTGQNKETTAQDAVDAAYDHYADGKDKKGSNVEWDESWETGNEDEKRADEIGKKYGEKRKENEEKAEEGEKERYTDDQGIVHHISGGDEIIDPEYTDVIIFDEPQAPQSSVVEEEEGFSTTDPTEGNPDFGWVLSDSEDEAQKTR